MNTLTYRELHSDDDIQAAFPLMAALRDRIRPGTFLAEVASLAAPAAGDVTRRAGRERSAS